MAKTQNQTNKSTLPAWVTRAVILLSLPAFFLGLSVPFIGPDEPRYAEVGREMFQSGDWITPTLAGYHWFEKPPLLYWLEAFFYSIFGVNEFAARLGPALCGLATILCLWLTLRSALTEKEPDVANWCGCISASTLGLITFSHAATTDVVVTLPLTVAMCSYFLYDRRSETSDGETKWPLVLMYAAAGLALLAKGLIGIIFPPAIILFYHVLSRRLPTKQLLATLVWGIPLTLSIAAVWYVPMYVKYRGEFVDEFILRQHFERFTTNVFQHPQPFYFYLYILPLMTLPWLPSFLVGLWKSSSQAIQPPMDERGRSLLLFSLAWFLVPLVFFSTSSSKLPGYVLPALPPAMIMSAAVVGSLARIVFARWIFAAIAAATLIAVVVILPTVFPARAAQESVKPLLEAADARGFSSTKLLLLHSASFSAEFYAPERLEREPDGSQSKLYGPAEVADKLRELNIPDVLVLVPNEYRQQLLEYGDLRSEVLAQNHDDAIVLASLR